MTNDFIQFLPQDHPMIYYLLPSVVKRRCLALKKISLEHETLDNKYHKERHEICAKFASTLRLSPSSAAAANGEELADNNGRRAFLCPFDGNPLELIARKADDLKAIALSHPTTTTTTRLAANNKQGNNSGAVVSFPLNIMKELLNNCETKCHELMTHLANIDWELYEYEELLASYHGEMEALMAKYNMELSFLYKERLKILRGEHEPDNDEVQLPDYILTSSRPPKYFATEQENERIYSIKYSQEAERSMGQSIKGVPGFWLQSLTIALQQVCVIEPADRAPLSYLADVRYYYDTERDLPEVQLNTDRRTQLLLFFFDENPHFSNRILSKTLHIDKSREQGREMYDGIWVTKKEGCTINWYKGKDITATTTTQQLVDLDEKCHNQQQQPLASFFNFFSERGLESNKKVRRQNNEINFEVELDYDVFVRFRDFIAPHAIVAYSRGNLFGFEDEHHLKPGVKLAQKMYYIDTLFDNPLQLN